LLPVLERFRHIIRDYRITSFEEAGVSFRLRAVLEFVDGSQLHVRETLIGGEKRKYAMPITGKPTMAVSWYDGTMAGLGCRNFSSPQACRRAAYGGSLL